MKKVKFLALMLAAVSIASCSDDNEKKSAAQSVAGDYEGYTVASCAYFKNQVTPSQKVVMTEAGVDELAVSFVSDSWGTVSIPSVSVTEIAGGYAVTGSGTSRMGMGGNVKEYTCNLTGKIINGVAGLSFACPEVMGGLTIEFNQGEIPASIVVPGNYTGYTQADCAYFKGMMADDQTVKITAGDNNTYTVSYTSDTWGEFNIVDAVAVSNDGGKSFTISGNGVTTMGMNGNVNEYQCSMEGTVDAAKENVEFKFSVPAVMGGLTVTFSVGEMPAEE